MLAIIVITAATLMGFAHYGAPRLLRRNPLPRLLAYVAGVGLGILAPFAAWIWVSGGSWRTFLDLLAICAGAGAGTVLAWALDEWGK